MYGNRCPPERSRFCRDLIFTRAGEIVTYLASQQTLYILVFIDKQDMSRSPQTLTFPRSSPPHSLSTFYCQRFPFRYEICKKIRAYFIPSLITYERSEDTRSGETYSDSVLGDLSGGHLFPYTPLYHLIQPHTPILCDLRHTCSRWRSYSVTPPVPPPQNLRPLSVKFSPPKINGYAPADTIPRYYLKKE